MIVPILMPAEEVFASDTREHLRNLIARNGGNEVFVIGTCTEDGKVAAIEPVAFGNASSVPAPAQKSRSGQVLIHNHPSGSLEPSDPDISLASRFGAANVGFFIVDNEVMQVRVVVRPFFPEPEIALNIDEIATEFEPAGRLAKKLARFERRPQQIAMMRAVTKAFNEHRILVVEAGTGVGKSLAYLVPAALWATQNQARVVVSTNTINLQEQLLTKDIPTLKDALGLEFSVALVKGRNNYLSLRRLGFAREHPDLIGGAKSEELDDLAAWAETTTDGSKADLPFVVSDETWQAVQSDHDDCMRAQCPHFQKCFFYRARRTAANSQIVIANHHLVLADLATRKAAGSAAEDIVILPRYDHIIFDEAHNLDEVATGYFSATTSLPAVRRQLNWLHARKGDRKGALSRLQGEILSLDPKQRYVATQAIAALFGPELDKAYIALEAALETHFPAIERQLGALYSLQPFGRSQNKKLIQQRIEPQKLETDEWASVVESVEEIRRWINEFGGIVAKMIEAMDTYPAEIGNMLTDLRLSIYASTTKLLEQGDVLHMFAHADEEAYCRWFELNPQHDRPILSLCVAPVDLSQELRQGLLKSKATVVMTSATLTVGGKFDFFARHVGLPRTQTVLRAQSKDEANTSAPGIELTKRVDYLVLDSPFDYQRACLLGVPTDLPSPNDPAFEAEAMSVVLEALRLTRGHAFVLCTSYDTLNNMHKGLAETLRREGMTVLRQGSLPREQLIRKFRETRHSVLFATASFWEGVDVQGEALQNVIIMRLPFQPPTTPILQARSDVVAKRGGDVFRELSLPYAVIRFKQGFGRLIRSKRDRGILLVLDPRLVRESYGKTFLKSLPSVRIVADKHEKVLGALRDFVQSWQASDHD